MEKQPILRYSPNASIGLTEEQVQQRVAQKQTNKVKKVVGKSYVAIVTSNVLTFFNLLGFIIFVIYALCGSFDNMAFVAIISANTLLGIIQEIRSKIAVERLAIVHQPTIDVVRNGKQQTVATKDVVLDDVVVYSAGKQICADGIVLEGQVEVNESMLTGESVAVKKVKGDVLYSGSYVVSGNCTALADKVGKECYVEKLFARVKRTKAPNSQLMKGIGT
ncbi:MAG: cation-translocating P-type ATPase, partial [Clostridia bacterium]|nr:cation-translocating P-type ATPase [Clostridia bacterium]